MSVNGPKNMYNVKPLYDIYLPINLPNCMYKMKNLYADNMSSEKVQDDMNLLEVEKHQRNIIQKLEDLKEKVLKMKEEFGIQNQAPSITHAPDFENFQDIVIKANPAFPPLSLWVFYKILSRSTSARIVSYIHSSLSTVPEIVKNLQNLTTPDSCKVSLTLVWREGDKDHEMMIDPVNQGMIEGEINIARYIARLLDFNYDTDPILSTQIDNWLELAHSSIIHGSNKERQSALKSLNSHLGKNNYLVGNSLSVADIVFWSSVVQTRLHENLPANVLKWYKSLLGDEIFAYCNSLL